MTTWADVLKVLLESPIGAFLLLLLAPLVVMAVYAIYLKNTPLMPKPTSSHYQGNDVIALRHELNAAESSLRSQIRQLTKALSDLNERMTRYEAEAEARMRK